MFFLLFLIAFANADNGHKKVYNTWPRVVMAGKDILNYTSSGSRVTDPNGTRTRDFLGHTEADILAQREVAFTRFKENFGIDVLATGTHNEATDMWILPGRGYMITYANGDDLRYRLIFDSWNKDVEKDGAHIMYQWGYLLQLSSNGTFPGGKLAGKPYAKNDVIGATQLVWLDLKKREHWNNPMKCGWKCRETSDSRSERPAQQTTNSDGLINNFDAADLFNRRSEMSGFLASHVTTRYLDDGVTSVQMTRNTVTLGEAMEFKLPY